MASRSADSASVATDIHFLQFLADHGPVLTGLRFVFLHFFPILVDHIVALRAYIVRLFDTGVHRQKRTGTVEVVGSLVVTGIACARR